MKLLKKYEFRYLEHTPEEVVEKLIKGIENAGMVFLIHKKGRKFLLYNKSESRDMYNSVFYGNLVKVENETIIQGRFGYYRYVKYNMLIAYAYLFLFFPFTKSWGIQLNIPDNQKIIFVCGIYLISILLFIIYTAIYKKRRVKIIEYIKNIMN